MKQQGKLTMTKLMTGAAVVALMTAPAAHALDGEPIKIGYAAANHRRPGPL